MIVLSRSTVLFFSSLIFYCAAASFESKDFVILAFVDQRSAISLFFASTSFLWILCSSFRASSTLLCLLVNARKSTLKTDSSFFQFSNPWLISSLVFSEFSNFEIRSFSLSIREFLLLNSFVSSSNLASSQLFRWLRVFTTAFCYFFKSCIILSCSNIFCSALVSRSSIYFLALFSCELLLLSSCSSSAILFLLVFKSYLSCCYFLSYYSLFFSTSNRIFSFNSLIVFKCSVMASLRVVFYEFRLRIRSSSIFTVFYLETSSSCMKAFSIFLRSNSSI